MVHVRLLRSGGLSLCMHQAVRRDWQAATLHIPVAARSHLHVMLVQMESTRSLWHQGACQLQGGSRPEGM